VIDSGQSSGINSDLFTIKVYDKNGVLYRQIGDLGGSPPYWSALYLKGGNVVIHPSK
jgi:hypothetical protein